MEPSVLVPEVEAVENGAEVGDRRGLMLASSRPSSSAASSGPSPGRNCSKRFRSALCSWPWATFIANVLGAFLLGYFITRLQERLPVSAYRRPLLGTGLCGGFTTFSTMQIELLRMFDADRVGLAVAYALVSVGAGLLVVVIATNLVRRARFSG